MIIVPDYDYDYYGGFSLYLCDRLIGRLYYLTLDNKPFFSAVPDDITPEEYERLNWWVGDKNDQVVMIDNLTGIRIPNDQYDLQSLFMIGCFNMCPSIRFKKRPNTFEGQTVAGCVKTTVMLFPKFLMKLPNRIIRAMTYYFRLSHYAKLAEKQLLEKVESHLASQKTAVIDLRRGCYPVRQSDDTCKYVASTDTSQHSWPTPFVPLKKEFLTHIEAFVLALPAQNQSEFYLQLRSWIDPEKVVELVLFDPINLDDFLMYKSIKKLSLVGAKNLQSFKGLSSFEQLEHVFISSDKDKSELFDVVEISNKITVDCVFGGIFGTKDRFKRWKNGGWCACPQPLTDAKTSESNPQAGGFE